MCEGCEERIHVGHQVHRIDRSISKLLEMRVKEEGLDEIALMHGWILRYLYEHQDKEIYQKDIEEKFCVTRSTVSKVLKGMESKGLLRRESVSSDARLKRLVLTEEGREINANAAVERIELENRIRDGLSDEEFHTLMHLLKRVADNMLEE